MDRRKELQNEYGMRKRAMGVFAIRHEESGKRYVASTSTLDSVWGREKFMLKLGTHKNSKLQAEWNRDGEGAFEFEVLETLKLGDEVRNDYKDIVLPGASGLRSDVVMSYRDALRRLETKWLEQLQPFEPNGYNSKPKSK